MNLKSRNLLAIAGIIGAIVGITIAIPSFLKENYIVGTLSIMLLMGGIILLAIAFGEEND